VPTVRHRFMQTTIPTHRFRLIPRTSNRKLGANVAKSISSRSTCPNTCGFFRNGCYGDQWPMALHWQAVSDGATTRDLPWEEHLQQISSLPAGRLFRVNQVGDLPPFNNGQPNQPGFCAQALFDLALASRRLKAWLYSHHPLGVESISMIRLVGKLGFSFNSSCQTEREADSKISQGVHCVITVPSTETRTHWRTAEGKNRVQICPQQLNPAVTCATCRLCIHGGRESELPRIIAFKAHGNGKRKVDAALAGVANG